MEAELLRCILSLDRIWVYRYHVRLIYIYGSVGFTKHDLSV